MQAKTLNAEAKKTEKMINANMRKMYCVILF